MTRHRLVPLPRRWRPCLWCRTEVAYSSLRKRWEDRDQRFICPGGQRRHCA